MHPNWAKLLRRKFTSLFPVWYAIEYAAVRIMMALINLLPIALSTWIARRIGEAIFFILPRRRRIAFENLTIAFGSSKSDQEKTRLALESFRHLITSFMEFFRLPKVAKRSTRYIRFKGTEHLVRPSSQGKGVILAMPHLGPWEYLMFLTQFVKRPATIMGRAVRNPYIYQWIKSLRTITGLKYSDKDMGIRGIFSELKKKHLVGIAIDQWAGNDGIWVDFFGTPTSTTSLPARLAEKTGSSLVFGYCIRLKSGTYEIQVEPEIPFRENDNNWVENVTKELNHRLEEKIRLYPEQWAWTHRRWKNKRHTPKLREKD